MGPRGMGTRWRWTSANSTPFAVSTSYRWEPEASAEILSLQLASRGVASNWMWNSSLSRCREESSRDSLVEGNNDLFQHRVHVPERGRRVLQGQASERLQHRVVGLARGRSKASSDDRRGDVEVLQDDGGLWGAKCVAGPGGSQAQ